MHESQTLIPVGRAGRFGFETSATMTAGLWAGSTSLTADFATVIWRIQLLGFNTIRLPFSFQARPSAHPDCAIFVRAFSSQYMALCS